MLLFAAFAALAGPSVHVGPTWAGSTLVNTAVSPRPIVGAGSAFALRWRHFRMALGTENTLVRTGGSTYDGLLVRIGEHGPLAGDATHGIDLQGGAGWASLPGDPASTGMLAAGPHYVVTVPAGERLSIELDAGADHVWLDDGRTAWRGGLTTRLLVDLRKDRSRAIPDIDLDDLPD